MDCVLRVYELLEFRRKLDLEACRIFTEESDLDEA
jgi:hypothetical protein